MASILRIANLCKTYKITEVIKEDVLKGVNLELNEGEMVAIRGESGCGKSTLLNILGGLDLDYTGSVIIKGNFIRDFSEDELDDYRKKRIGMIFQSYNLLSHMTIKENVMLAMQMSDCSKDIQEKRACDLLTLVGLYEYRDKYPNTLSGGQCQRVSIARALANNPSIILADEPTGALDKESTLEVIDILKKITEMGKLVIVVTHSSIVSDYASRIVTLDDGVIKEDKQISPPKKNKFEKYREIKPKSIGLKSLFKMALNNILSNKFRNFLTSIGISIGIMSLIIILALSSGITSYVNKYFSQDETNEILTITSDSNISYSTIKEISNIDGVTNVLSSYRLNSVKYTNSKLEDTYTINYTYSTDTKNQPDVLYGNMPTNLGEVAIDIDIAESIYTDTSIIAAINDTIDLTYNNLTYTFKIVGIYDDGLDIKSSYISEDSLYVFNNLYQTSYDAISGYYYNICYVKVKNITYLNSVSNSIRGISSSLTITTTNQESETILDYIDLATKVLTVLSLLSLSVAAIMIIIVQYVSIVERTKEIGILRSIGGRRKDILYLFLFESLILGSLGGMLAVSVSYLLAGITNIICYISTKCIFISFNPIWYLIGFMVSVLVSILAGITPARKASSLDPITCLRSE